MAAENTSLPFFYNILGKASLFILHISYTVVIQSVLHKKEVK